MDVQARGPQARSRGGSGRFGGVLALALDASRERFARFAMDTRGLVDEVAGIVDEMDEAVAAVYAGVNAQPEDAHIDGVHGVGAMSVRA